MIPETAGVVELRQYTLQPGKRDVLVDLFDREFVETQEAVGIRLYGQFRDMDDPNRFVFVRGFRDMASRAEALRAFYGGPVWKAHRDAANATMVDSSNVLLLRPVTASPSFVLARKRPEADATGRRTSLVVATVYFLDVPVDGRFLGLFDRMKPLFAEAGTSSIACFSTEYAENTFPTLPVRTGVNAFVWFSMFATPADYDDYLGRLARSARWMNVVYPQLASHFAAAPQQLRLEPTSRSLLGHSS